MALPNNITVTVHPIVNTYDVVIKGLETDSYNVIWVQDRSITGDTSLLEAGIFLTKSGIICYPDTVENVKLFATVNGVLYESEIISTSAETFLITKS